MVADNAGDVGGGDGDYPREYCGRNVADARYFCGAARELRRESQNRPGFRDP